MAARVGLGNDTGAQPGSPGGLNVTGNTLQRQRGRRRRAQTLQTQLVTLPRWFAVGDVFTGGDDPELPSRPCASRVQVRAASGGPVTITAAMSAGTKPTAAQQLARVWASQRVVRSVSPKSASKPSSDTASRRGMASRDTRWATAPASEGRSAPPSAAALS